MNGNPVYISIFNNKGGVGKTTIIWNVSYSLAEKRKKVLLVDFDPQCNLSIAMLGQKGFEKLLESNRHVTGSTIKDFVLPFILKNEISTIKTQIPSYKTGNGLLGYPGIELIPGDFWMNRFADILNVGTDVIGGSGLFRFLILKKLVETLDNNYDYVLIDLPPSFNTLVRSAIYCSDYFMVPCTPDLFSAYCVTLIGETLPLFLQDLETGKDRYMKYDRDTIIEQSGHIKFGGWIFNGYDTRKDQILAADQSHRDQIQEAVEGLIETFKKVNSSIIPAFISSDPIAGIEDLNVMISESLKKSTPIKYLGSDKPDPSLAKKRASWSQGQKALLNKVNNEYDKIGEYIINNFK